VPSLAARVSAGPTNSEKGETVKRIVSWGAGAAAVTAAAAMALWLAVPAGATATSGTENFQIVSTSATSSTSSVIATGVFTVGGVDHSGNKVDRLVFPTGSFKVAHKGPEKQNLNKKTCLFTITGTGTFKISGGTGAYKTLSGSGTYKLSILAILARAGGKCSMRSRQPPSSR
jgi:hypothetical protein